MADAKFDDLIEATTLADGDMFAISLEGALGSRKITKANVALELGQAAGDTPVTDAGAFYTGADVEAILQEISTWQDYTPALTADTTSPTLGSGSSAVGRYLQIGNFVSVHLKIVFGSSGVVAGSGVYRVSVPVTGRTADEVYQTIGWGTLFDTSGGVRKVATALWHNTNRDRVILNSEAGTADVGAAVPWTWAASDQINLSLVYEAA